MERVQWHANGTTIDYGSLAVCPGRKAPALTWVFYLGVGDGNRAALSAWELYGAAWPPPADWLTCGSIYMLSVRDRDCLRWFLLPGT